MNSSSGTAETVGFPIRTSPDQRLLGISPKLFAANRVLHRLLVPRHPPYALKRFFLLLLTWQSHVNYKREFLRSRHAQRVSRVGHPLRFGLMYLSLI